MARRSETAPPSAVRLSLRAVARGGRFAGLALLLGLAGRAYAEKQTGREIVISVPEVPGPYCVYSIDKRVRELTGVQRVDFLWPQEKLRVMLAADSRVTASDVRQAVERSEYPYRYTVSGP
ncbi:MAG TPA: hypothetical protein VGE84_06475 [Allosphingosinicella sp.]